MPMCYRDKHTPKVNSSSNYPDPPSRTIAINKRHAALSGAKYGHLTQTLQVYVTPIMMQ